MAARAGENDLARVLLEKAAEDMKDVPAYLLTTATVEYRLGNYNRAVDRLERLARMQPNNVKVQRMLARALYQIGDAEGALALIRPLAERSDGDAYARMVTGRALEALDKRDDAAPFIDAATAVPTNVSSQWLSRPGYIWKMIVFRPWALLSSSSGYSAVRCSPSRWCTC